MPIYIFQHPRTQEIKEIVQKMLDAHEYSEDGVKWNRIFSIPQANVTVAFDPFSQKNFVEKTKGTKTYGDAWRISQEYSDARAEKLGHPDPIATQALKKDRFQK